MSSPGVARKLWRSAAPLCLLLLATPAAGQQKDAAVEEGPRCVAGCREMLAKGELAPGVDELTCQIRVCHQEARSYYEENEFDNALMSLNQIHDLVRNSASYQFDRGLVQYALGDFEAALEAFDFVLSQHPESVRGSAQRAHTLVRMNRVPEARAQFSKILSFEEADGEYRRLRTRSYVHGNLGVLALMQADLAGGKKELEKALEIDGRNALVRTFLTKVVPALEDRTLEYESVHKLVVAFEELSLRHPNPALRQLSKVLNESPDYRVAYLLTAETQRRYMDFKGCELTLRMAEKRFKDDTEVYVNRLRCTMLRYGIHSPQAVGSIAELKALAEKDPNHPLVQEMMVLITD